MKPRFNGPAVVGASFLQLMPLRSMSAPELQGRLRLMARRARTISGTGIDESGQVCALGAQAAAFLENLAANLTDPKAATARAEFMAKVKKDPRPRNSSVRCN